MLRYHDRATPLNWTMTAWPRWALSTNKHNRICQFFRKRFNQRELYFLFAYSFYSASAQLAMQSAVLAIVNPSVCLSVTRWHWVKTTQATIMGSSLEDSPMILVSSRLTSPQNSKGNMGSEGAEWERGRKNRQFLANKSPYLRNGAR